MTRGNSPNSDQDPNPARESGSKPGPNAEKRAKSAPKVPRKVTADRLRNIALYHLERYATSAENLRRVLHRRVLKAARHHDTDMEQASAWIDEIVSGLVRAGAVDDRQFAEAKARSMTRRGQSRRKIQAYLAAKGVDRETLQNALAALNDENGDPDESAAHAYAMRRRIGPYRRGEDSPEVRQKELATLGRAGFSYEIARRLLNSEPNE